jgi:hypothetical protein
MCMNKKCTFAKRQQLPVLTNTKHANARAEGVDADTSGHGGATVRSTDRQFYR